jgi:regulator of RNase E activity RraA
MQRASKEVLEGLTQFDSATVFNAVVESMGASQGGRELQTRGGIPECYTGPEIRCLLPEFGCVVGYAVTAEVATNDPDSVGVPWDSYYEVLEKTGGPIIATMKDVDTRPGRGAAFGDNMAAAHKALGVVGAVVDGTVRDVLGIKAVGLPVWGHGLVPGHGVFTLVRVNGPVTIGQLLVHPGDLLVADMDGCTKIPSSFDPAALLEKCRQIRKKEQSFQEFTRQPGFSVAKWKKYRKK